MNFLQILFNSQYYLIWYLILTSISLITLDYIEKIKDEIGKKLKTSRYSMPWYMYLVIYVFPPIWIYILFWGLKTKHLSIKFKKGAFKNENSK